MKKTGWMFLPKRVILKLYNSLNIIYKKQIVKQIPSRVKDNNHFTHKIKQFQETHYYSQWKSNRIYKCSKQQRNSCCWEKYNNYPPKTICLKVKTIFSALLLTFNNFVFYSKLDLKMKRLVHGDNMCTRTYSRQNSRKNTSIH